MHAPTNCTMLRSLHAFSTAISCRGKHQACHGACHKRMWDAPDSVASQLAALHIALSPACRHRCRKARSLPAGWAAPAAKHVKHNVQHLSARETSAEHTQAPATRWADPKRVLLSSKACRWPRCRNSSFRKATLSGKAYKRADCLGEQLSAKHTTAKHTPA